MMKKILAIVLASVMVISLAACGGSSTAETEAPATEAVAEETEAVVEETEAVTSPKAEETVAQDIVDTSVVSADERAAALGIPAAVKLQDTKALEGKKIGCTICYKGDEWCAALADALESLAEYYGATCACEDGDLNDETQTKQIENMMASNCDIIFADPITPDGSDIALSAAVDKGIPVVIYDGHWVNGDEKAVSTVTWDQYDTGVIVANYFLDYIREHSDGKATIVELTNAVATHCQERFQGLHDTFDKADDVEIKILNKYDSQGNRETAANAIAAVVEPYDYIISDVDNGAMGAVSALQSVGNTDVKVFSMGAYGEEPFTLLHENDPNYTACLNVDAWVLAQYVYESAINYYEGKDVDKTTNIALYMVDSSNVEDFWSFD